MRCLYYNVLKDETEKTDFDAQSIEIAALRNKIDSLRIEAVAMK
jgi:hypothetical protein